MTKDSQSTIAAIKNTNQELRKFTNLVCVFVIFRCKGIKNKQNEQIICINHVFFISLQPNSSVLVGTIYYGRIK